MQGGIYRVMKFLQYVSHKMIQKRNYIRLATLFKRNIENIINYKILKEAGQMVFCQLYEIILYGFIRWVRMY